MEFTVITQLINNTLEGVDEKVSFVKLNSHIPVNWMGSYVYVDGLQLKANLPRFVFDYDLILYYNDDIVGKQIIISESDMDNNIGRFNSPFLMLPEKGHEDIKLYRLNSHFKRGH